MDNDWQIIKQDAGIVVSSEVEKVLKRCCRMYLLFYMQKKIDKSSVYDDERIISKQEEFEYRLVIEHMEKAYGSMAWWDDLLYKLAYYVHDYDDWIHDYFDCASVQSKAQLHVADFEETL